MKKIYTTTLRLNLEDESDRRAYERLKSMGKSVSKTVVSAVNGYFDWQEKLLRDPYLETREKEDAFLKSIAETVERALRFAPVETISPVRSVPEIAQSAEDDENISAALDFAGSF